uniref:Gamma-tubulin complex component n=1 Tax=Mesocestoides corti TaxID=53468 RepID=A0A5K3FS33_MESCO
MLHELIFALHGFPGDICSQAPVADPSSTPESRLKLLSDRLPFVTPSEISIVSQLLSIGEKYLKLQRFIEQFCLPFSGSLYLTALAYGIDEVLNEYRNALCNVETDLLSNPYNGITYIFSRIEPFRPLLFSLTELLDLCSRDHQKNLNLINSVLRVQKSPAQSIVLRQLMRVFRHQLSNWLLFGTLHDPYDEFCINSECNLLPETFPSIISPTLANDILYIGKAVRTAGGKLSERLEEMFSGRFLDVENSDLVGDVDEDLENLIREVCSYVSGEVSRQMFSEYEIVQNLTLVKDVLLLGRGELFVMFFDNLLAEGGGSGRDLLDRPIPATIAEARGLAYGVNSAFFAAARAVGLDDEDLASRFRFVVSMNPHNDETLTDGDEDDDDSRLTAWDCLSLEFTSPPAGLETIFTEAARGTYLRLFSFLLTVRRTEHVLSTSWLRDRSRMKLEGDLDQRMVLRHRMAFIVNNLNCYLQVSSSVASSSLNLAANFTHSPFSPSD